MDDLDKAAGEIMACRLCDLHLKRTFAVPGEGNKKAELMIIGEAPGKFEDRAGRPFIGMSGKFLTGYLERVGIRREDVFITNSVKCRPPENRKPTMVEIEACRPYLIRQLKVIKPKLVLALGTSAANSLNMTYKQLNDIRGKVLRTSLDGADFDVFVTFHPSFPMRFPSKRSAFIQDLKHVKEIIGDKNSIT